MYHYTQYEEYHTEAASPINSLNFLLKFQMFWEKCYQKRPMPILALIIQIQKSSKGEPSACCGQLFTEVNETVLTQHVHNNALLFSNNTRETLSLFVLLYQKMNTTTLTEGNIAARMHPTTVAWELKVYLFFPCVLRYLKQMK